MSRKSILSNKSMPPNYNKLLKNTTTTIRDDFWYEDIMVLFKFNRVTEFFPTDDMTIEEKLNSIARLSIYVSLILSAYCSNSKYLYIAIVTMLLTVMIYTNGSTTITEKFTDVTYVKPTLNNPFMNILPDDYITRPNRDSLNKANSYINTGLNNYMDDKYNYNLYKDADDVFDNNTTQRQFYTMPVTTIPNQQTKFAKWLYATPPTCKEGNGNQCVANNWDFLKDSKIRNGIF